MKEPPINITRTLVDLQRYVGRINRLADVVPSPELDDWHNTLERKLLTRLAPDFPLIAAICGGGSAGKSTLLNSRFQQRLSPAGGQAGLNRRVLAVIPPRIVTDPESMARLEEIMGSALAPLTDSGQLTRPGPPLFIAPEDADPDLVLLDTPDFDTGSGHDYTNRPAASQAMAAADLLIYIFTNATYNHRDNTDFVAARLTELGMRDCMLVYRVYPSFSDQEVLDHAATVGRNIYGPLADRQVLGVFRVDEDNRVAAGSQWMSPVQVGATDQTLWQALGHLDPQALRQKLLGSMLVDVTGWADRFETGARGRMAQFARYQTALTDALMQSVRQAVRQFPMAEVLARFAHLWSATDPAWMRAMRATGHWLDKPVRWFSRRVLQTGSQPPAPLQTTDAVEQKLTADLIQAANGLRRRALEKQLAPAGGLEQTMIAVPVPFQALQSQLRERAWAPVLETLTRHPELSNVATPAMDAALLELVHDFRARMGVWDKLRQSAAAFLNVLPATVAVTYILATADPVGAAGLKIKLTGLLGLHDLYALVALPATSGMKAADQQQLQNLLAPLAEVWLDRRTRLIEALLREHVVGQLLDSGQKLKEQLQADLQHMTRTLETLKKGMHE